jgi:N-methylhydantoinase B
VTAASEGQARPEVDPVTLEVVRNALVGIAEEAGAALRRTAYSPNIKERADCSTAVFDPRARMVAQAEHIPVHLGSMPASVRAALDAFGSLAPGDQVLVSDPYEGGTHLPDWTLVGPVHDGGGRLLGFAANRAHHSDVGGSAPGSMPAGATEIYAEGLRIPPVKLHVRGQEQRDLVALLLANTRTPHERLGDLRAQVGANRATAARLRELADDLGPDLLDASTAATLDHAERTVRAAIAGFPDGTYRFEDVLDGDGTGVGPIPIRVSVTIAGDELTCDLSGSADQVPGSVNAPRAVTVSAAIYALRAVAAPDAPANDGTVRPLTVVTRPGSVVDPRPPASVAAGNVETSQRIVDVLLGALAQAVPDRVPAASQGTMNNTLLGGTDPASGQPFTYYETLAGGTGAGPWGPGASGTHSHMTNTKNTPIEAFELAYPLRVVEYRLRDGSGGRGEHRGGDGLRRVLEVLTDDATGSLLTERRDRGPWGARGGGDGAPGNNALIRDGEERRLPAKVTVRLRRGDRLVVETPGGGGYGAADQAAGPSSASSARP